MQKRQMEMPPEKLKIKIRVMSDDSDESALHALETPP
jgi:hypothetical protein